MKNVSCNSELYVTNAEATLFALSMLLSCLYLLVANCLVRRGNCTFARHRN